MPDTTPADVVAELHVFGLQRDRFRSAMAGAFGLTTTDLDALEYLERYGPQTPGDLSERLVLTSGAVTMLVDRLERLNLVGRRANPADRRSTLVELVPAADLPDAPEVHTYHQQILAAAAAIPQGQRRQMMEFLSQVAAHAATAAEELRRRTPRGARKPATGPKSRPHAAT